MARRRPCSKKQVLAVLQAVRTAGSGIPAADRALKLLVREGGELVAQGVAQAMQNGWLLFGDGEPAALTVEGLRQIIRPAAAAKSRRSRSRPAPQKPLVAPPRRQSRSSTAS